MADIQNCDRKAGKRRILGPRSIGLILGVGIALVVLTIVLAAWQSPVNLYQLSNYSVEMPDVEYDSSGYAHVVFQRRPSGGSPEVMYLTNLGGSWQNAVSICSTCGGARIAVGTDGHVHVAWDNGSAVFYREGTISGNTVTWGSIVQLTNYKSYGVFVTVDQDNNVYVAYTNGITSGTEFTEYRARINGVWADKVIPTQTTIKNRETEIAVTGDAANRKIHIVFHTFYGGNDFDVTDIMYISGNGTIWSPQVNLSDSPSIRSLGPAITVDRSNGYIYVTWIEARYPGYVTFRRSTDNGATWSAGLPNVSNPPANGLSQGPDISAGGGIVHMTWFEKLLTPLSVYHRSWDGASYSPINTLEGNNDWQSRIARAPAGAPGAVWEHQSIALHYSYDPAYGAPPTPSPTSPTATSTPSPSPTATATPTPSPTPDPRPRGFVDILATDPPYNPSFTRLLTTTLVLSATAAPGAYVTDMWVCNVGNCPSPPQWIPFAQSFPNWLLLDDGYDCEYKWINAAFRDNQLRESLVVGDYIRYDNYLTASMSLNEDRPYTNRTMVMVNSVDLDGQQQDCSGLRDMRLREEPNLTYTIWITYYPQLYFFLSPSGGSVRTVDTEYKDRANNVGAFSDSIALDVTPPYSGAAPILNNGISPTTHLVIPVSGLLAYDDESGVANVWLANRPDGPWMSMPYCANPPCSYDWNLGYGGPPIQYPGLHYVYVKYEDGAGYGSFPGNFSPVYSSAIEVSGISNVFLPVLDKGHGKGLVTAPVQPPADLILLADRQQVQPGDDVLLYLAVRPSPDAPPEATLRMLLPEGLRVVRAWSVYGQLLQADGRTIVSRERLTTRLTPWILVHVRVEAGASAVLPIQGSLTWDGGSIEAAPVQIENR